MKTHSIPLLIAVCFGASLVSFAAPPPKKKPDSGVTIVVPVPVPVVPQVVVPVKPPVVAPPPPKPVGAAVRFCGVERAHAAHQFRGRGGVLYRCPGKGAPGPKGPPPRRP